MMINWYKNKMRHLARVLLRRFKPETFFNHPYWVEAWAFYATYGMFPSFWKPKTIDEKQIVHNIKLWKEYKKYLSGKKYDEALLGEAKLRILCADKFRVREYVKSKVGENTLVSLIGAYDTIDEVDFNGLPKAFVLKMNNASSRNFICKDKSKIDIGQVKLIFREWQNECTYGASIGEWHYSFIQPKIVCEEYLDALGEVSVIDYKFHCFKGKVHSCFVCYDRDPISHEVIYDHYDINWNHTEATRPIFRKNERPIPKPKHYEEMLVIASKLSSNIPYCRVDLYEVNDKVYFGEITLTPMANLQVCYEPSMLLDLGNNFKSE